jgi:hypothetical protein
VSDESTDQPVMTVEWWKAAVTGGVLAVSTLLIAFDEWHPTDAQLIAIGGVGTWLVLTLFPLIAYFVHNRVTPVSNVALTKKDAQILEAAQLPAVDVADLRAVARGSYPPYEEDPKP